MTFWSGFVLTSAPLCVPLDVYVDGARRRAARGSRSAGAARRRCRRCVPARSAVEGGKPSTGCRGSPGRSRSGRSVHRPRPRREPQRAAPLPPAAGGYGIKTGVDLPAGVRATLVDRPRGARLGEAGVRPRAVRPAGGAPPCASKPAPRTSRRSATTGLSAPDGLLRRLQLKRAGCVPLEARWPGARPCASSCRSASGAAAEPASAGELEQRPRAPQPSRRGSSSSRTTRRRPRGGTARSPRPPARRIRAPGRRAPRAARGRARRRRSTTSRGSSARASGSAAYGPGAARRDEHAAVGERLELGEAVVLAPRRADEDARAAQQRAVLVGLQASGDAHAGRVEAQVGAGDDELLVLAARARPRPQDEVEALLVRVGGVRDRGDVALGGGRARRLDGDRHDDGVGVRARRLGERARVLRHEQRRGRSRRRSSGRCQTPWRPGRLAAAGRVVADRARSRPQQRGRDRRVERRRAARARRCPACAAARAARAQPRSVSANVRTSRGGRAATTATAAPARRSASASSVSAARSPAVEPSETSRMSAAGIG